MAEDDEENAHSERGPSTAHRWRLCPRSVRLSRGLPNTAGIAAAYGTVFHEVAAMCLQFDLHPQGFVGMTMTVLPHGTLSFDQEMADNMLFGLDVFRAYMDRPGVKFLVEKRVSLREWVGPNDFGTADFVVIDVENQEIICGDWKYGAGVPVSPENNDQAMLYVLGVWTDYAREMFAYHAIDKHGDDSVLDAPWEDEIKVTIIIEQPRAEGGGGVWQTTMGHVLEEGAKIRRDAALTEDEDAPVVPGVKQCQFCPAAKHNVCEARARYLMQMVGADFDDLEDDFRFALPVELPPPSAFTPEQRSQLLLNRPLFESLFDDLHAAAYKDAEYSRPTPGLKLVLGRAPPRKWRDERKMEPILVREFGKDAHEHKLISPTTVEEKLGRKAFRERFKTAVVQGQGKAVLVPVTDKREALQSLLRDFDDLDDEAMI